MKLNLQFLCALPIVLMVTACKEDEPNHTVQYFLDNAQAREEMMVKCEVTDEASSDANCVNATAATQAVVRETNRQSERDAVKSLYGDGS